MTESKVPGYFCFDMDGMAEEKPDFPVITFDNSPHPDEIITYGDLVLKGRKLARSMAEQGFRRGDTISLVMRNHPEVVITMYAASALGVVMVPIDPRSKGEKLRYQIKDSGSRGVLFSAELADGVQEALIGLDEVSVVGVMYRDDFGVPVMTKCPNLNEILGGAEAPGFSPGPHALNDPFMIIYTSGTTGNPKGVRLRMNRLQGYGLISQLVWQYTPQDKLYTGLSLTHGNAHAVTLTPALLHAIPAVISRRFSKSRIWDICRRHGCTTFSLLGGMMMGIYAEPERPDDADNPVQLVISAGTPPAIWEEFEKRFQVRIHEWYAAVEGGFAHKPPGQGPVGSFGKPLAGIIEMKVVREDDTECEPGEIGELISRTITGPTEVEYHGKEDASREKTRGGWLRSGDMVHRDEEGWLYFDYRKGGGLRRQGDFILPEHVERVIALRSDINDVCVYGIPASSGAPGESDLVAAVVAVEKGQVNIKGLFEACLARLERNSVPSFIQVVDEIPKTVSEKNLDRVLREEFNSEADNVYKFEDYTK